MGYVTIIVQFVFVAIVTFVLRKWFMYSKELEKKEPDDNDDISTERKVMDDFDVKLETPDAIYIQKKLKSLKVIEKKHQFFMGFLKKKIEKAIDVDNIDVTQPLASYGMSSMMAVQLTNDLSKSIGIQIPPTLLFNYPTIEKLAIFFEIHIFKVREKTEMKVKNPLMTKNLREPIAVIGIGCKFSGDSNDVGAYWDLLTNGKNGIIEVPKERWILDDFYSPDPDAFGKMYTKKGGFISDVDKFDPNFFKISGKEAEYMDPQQRVMLEVSWNTFENAGIIPSTLHESKTGVFVATCGSDYQRLLQEYRLKNPDDESIDHRFVGIGTSASVLAGRLSYFYGLKGPAITVDTACSSSLVTAHMACESLRTGASNLAIAGGINITLDPEIFVTFTKTRMLSPDGKCKTFDESANGYVRGEGCGLILLKRLSDARRDGDNILGLIKGSAINQDGKSAGITAPSGLSQEMVIKTALYNANLHPNDVDYIEAHGTGTSLGDPIEMQSLCSVFGGLNREKTLYVGSAKTNVGHTEGAAGIAGLLKVILSLKNEEIPKHLNLKQLNHKIPTLQFVPISIPCFEGQSWERDEDERRVAGISSFGFSGTNCHVIVEEAPFEEEEDDDESDDESDEDEIIQDDIICISAKSDYSLKELLKKYVALIKEREEDMDFHDFCYTQNITRTQFEKRIIIKANSFEQLEKKLTLIINEEDEDEIGIFKDNGSSITPKIVLFFTGQGSQYSGMGKELYETQAVFKYWMDECDRILNRYLKCSILDIIFDPNNAEKLNTTEYSQPALFAIEYSVAMMYKAMGIEPDYLVGHSLGEIVAACFAEVFTLEEGMKLICARAKYMELTAKGAMAAVFCKEEEITKIIKEINSTASIASINGETSLVISGTEEMVDNLLEELGNQKIKFKKLNVQKGFHSELMDPVLDEFEAAIQNIKYEIPYIPIVANVFGEIIEDIEFGTKYWKQHIRNPVKFYNGMKMLIEKEQRNVIFVEVGPKPHLNSMAKRIVGNNKEYSFVATLNEGKKQFQLALSKICATGANVAWKSFYANETSMKRKRITEVDLPVYQFQRKRYWIKQGRKNLTLSSLGHPLLGSQFILPSQTVFQQEIEKELFKDHIIMGYSILPATSYIEIALASISKLFKMEKNQGATFCVDNLTLKEPIPNKVDPTVQTVCKPIVPNKEYSVEVFTITSNDFDNSWKAHSDCQVSISEDFDDSSIEELISNLEESEEFNVDDFYAKINTTGYNYGTTYKALTKLASISEEETISVIEMQEEVKSTHRLDKYIVHPTILDSCFHSIIPLLEKEIGKSFLPVYCKKLRFYSAAKTDVISKVFCHSKLVSNDGKSIIAEFKIYDYYSKDLLFSLEGMQFREMQKKLLTKLLNEELKVFYETKWIESKKKKQKMIEKVDENDKKTIVIFQDKKNLGKTISHLLKEKCNIISVLEGKEFKKDKENNTFTVNPSSANDFEQMLKDEIFKKAEPITICYLWAMNINGEDLAKQYDNFVSLNCGSLMYICQNIVKNSIKIQKTFVITQGVFSEASNFNQSPILGMCRSLSNEHQELGLIRIDLDDKNGIEFNNGMIIVNEMFGDNIIDETFIEDEISYKNGKRYVPQFLQTSLTEEDQKEIKDEDYEKSYIVVGGTKGLGLEIAKTLQKKGFKKVVLVGRSEPKNKKELLENKFIIEQADVSDHGKLKEIFERNKPIYGIINSAGTWADGLIDNQKYDNFTKVLGPKVLGSWNLHLLSIEYNVKDFILFSSFAAVIGSPGQTNYSAANFFMDCLGNYRKSQNLPSLVINWGSWGEIGLASRKNIFVERFGLLNFSSKEGVEAFEKLFNCRFKERRIICPVLVNWINFLNAKPLPLPVLLKEIKEQNKWKKKTTNKKFERMQKKLASFQDESKRHDYFVSQIQSKVAKVLQTEPNDIDVHRPLMELGMDSLTAVELRNNVADSVGLDLPVTVLFDYPSIEKLASYLVEKIYAGGVIEGKEKEKKKVKKTVPTKKIDNEPIAIIGYSCRLPTGTMSGKDNDLKSFWEMLMEEKGCSEEIPANRFDIEDYYDKEGGELKMYVKWGTFINEPFHFDPSFFGISTQEAKSMDPQQRLLMTCTWEALESANIVPKDLAGSKTGVFVGNMFLDYKDLLDKYQVINYAGTGNHLSVLAGRVSYFFGFQGPVITMDTACSSSLVSTHQACQSLRTGECDMAVAGGVNLLISPKNYLSECNMRMLSPEGKCKTFDDSADGYLRGEGCGMILLKRLSEAKRDGNRILAVIKGSAVNHDGRSAGLTAPNRDSQERVINDALKLANLEPNDIDCIEAHGTGTSLGDPIEVNALLNTYGKNRSEPLVVATSKTYIGHSEGTAGIAGILKLVLQLRNEKIPRHINFKTINKLLPNLEEKKLIIPTEKTMDWKRTIDRKRIGAVSSFGFSGTNAHLIIEEGPVEVPKNSKDIDLEQIFTLSAKNPYSLKEMALKYVDFIEEYEDVSLNDLAFTLNVKKSLFGQRAVFSAKTKKEIMEKMCSFVAADLNDTFALQKLENKFTYGVVGQAKKSTVFLFTGQGSQYINMGKELYESQPVFKYWMDECDRILKEHLNESILEIIFDEKNKNKLNSTEYSQPTLFAIEYSVAMMYKAIGIIPDYLIGHSLGEIVAACFAGVFTLENGLKLISSRGKCMDATAKGAMAAVFCKEERISNIIKETNSDACIASVNGETSVVVSGTEETIVELLNKFKEEKIKFRKLVVERGFHSKLMEPALEPFRKSLEGIEFSEPTIPIVSNLFGEIIEDFDNHKMDIDYWVNHIRSPVKFLNGIETLAEKENNSILFVELGPRSHLTSMTKRILVDKPNVSYIETLKENELMFYKSICKLIVSGVNIDFERFYEVTEKELKNERFQVFDTPLYQFKEEEITIVPVENQIVRDTLYETEWKKVPLDKKNKLNGLKDGTVLVFADEDKKGKSRKFGEFLKVNKGVDVVGVVCSEKAKSCDKMHPTEKIYKFNPSIKEHYDELFSKKFWKKMKPVKYIVHMFSLDMEERELNEKEINRSILRNGYSMISLIQAIKRHNITAKVVFITKDVNTEYVMFNKKEGKTPSLLQSYIWGMDKTIRLEHPELDFKLVDIKEDTELQTIFDEINEKETIEKEVSYFKNQRYAPRMKIKTMNKHLDTNNYKIRPNDCYLITGGTSGLGFAFTKKLILKKGLKNVILLSRSGVKSEEVQKEIDRLMKIVKGLQIIVEKADVSKYQSLKDAMNSIVNERKLVSSITGIIHCAGIFDNGLITSEDFGYDRFARLYLPKVFGSLNMYKVLVDDMKMNLKRVVLFSSDVSQLGDRGQVTYAAVNAFLDYFSYYLKLKHNINAISINWGMFGDVGGVVDKSKGGKIDEKALTLLKYSGQGLLNVKKSYDYFEKIMADSNVSPRIGVVILHWNNLIRFKYDGNTPTFISDIKINTNEQEEVEEIQKVSMMAERLIKIESENSGDKKKIEELSKDVVKKDVINLVEDMLDKKPGTLDINADLGDIGVDSITALSIRNNLSKYAGVVLPVNMAFTTPTVAGLANFVFSMKGKVMEQAQNTLEGKPTKEAEEENSTVSTDIPFFNNFGILVKNYVSNLVKEAVGKEDIGGEDHLRQLEANVSLTTQVMEGLKKEFNVEINVREFFKRATINRYSNLVLKKLIPNIDESLLFKELDVAGQLEKSLGYIYESNWVCAPIPRPKAKLRLFMTPPAGTNPSFFAKIIKYFPEDVELCIIHLPGRTSRLNESLMVNMMECAKLIVKAIKPLVDPKSKQGKPFAFFGHCMGTQINFEVISELKRAGLPMPLHKFVFCGHSPEVANAKFPEHNKGNEGIIDFIKKTNGGDLPEPLKNSAMSELVLTIMRADLEKVASQDIKIKRDEDGKRVGCYHNYYKEDLEKFSFPITAWGGGKDDFVSEDDIKTWKYWTNGEFTMKMYPEEDHYPYVDVLGNVKYKKEEGKIPGIVDEIVEKVDLLIKKL